MTQSVGISGPRPAQYSAEEWQLLITVSPEAVRNSQEGDRETQPGATPTDRMVFNALLRKIDALDPSYKA